MAKNQNKAELSALSYIAYGGGNLAANLLVTTASNFITYFYTESVGISMAVAGIVLAACRVFDGFTDLFMGAVIDKTRSRYGKARPWLLRLAIPYLLACILLFSTPALGGAADVAYAAISYILAVCIVYTAISVPYNTMSARITKDQSQRTLLSVFRTFFGFGGAALVGSFSLKVVELFGGGRMGWSLMGVAYGILGMLLYLFCFKVCKELPDEFTMGVAEKDTETEQKVVEKTSEKTSIRKAVYALFHNKYWLLLMSCTMLTFIVSGLGGVNVYYAQYVLGSTDYMALLTMCSMVPMMVGALFMTPLVARFGARNTSLGGCVVMLIGAVIVMLFPENPVPLAVGLVVKALGASALAVNGFAMMGDTVEYSEWKFGVRPDGLTYSAITFGEKLGSAVGTVLVSSIMAAFGYTAQAATQSASSIFGMKVIFIYIPIAIAVICTVLLSFYDLDKKYDGIVADLKARSSVA